MRKKILLISLGASECLIILLAILSVFVVHEDTPMVLEGQALIRMLPLLISACIIDLILCVVFSKFVVKYIVERVELLSEAAIMQKTLPVTTDCKELEKIASILTVFKRNELARLEEVKAERNSKNEFIANVTHDMNTPLTAISGFGELIASGKLTKAQNTKNAVIIVEQAAKLKALIKSILNYSVIESEKAIVSEFDICEMAREAVTEFMPAAAKRAITITLDAPKIIKLTAPRPRVREIMDNFISNAIRYNKQGGTINVSLRAEFSRIRLAVSDTGIGIPPDKLPRVFDRFYTADLSHSSGGFGLGLAIVSKLASQYNWALNIASTINIGTTITIDF